MIRESLELLRRIRDELGQREIIVGFSGGKDSLVTLDLCSQVFDRIHGFFLFLIPGLECEERSLRMAETRYGLTIHRLRHPDMSRYMRYSRLRPCQPEVEDRIRRNLRWADIEAIMRSRTGADWIAQGHRITDSLQRRAMIQASEGFMPKERRVYPIWDWAPKAVFAYLRQKRIPIPPMFGSRVHKTSGLAPGNPDCLLWLKEHFPEDYRRVVKVFPGAETLLYRDELRANYQIEENSPLPAGIEA